MNATVTLVALLLLAFAIGAFLGSTFHEIEGFFHDGPSIAWTRITALILAIISICTLGATQIL